MIRVLLFFIPTIAFAGVSFSTKTIEEVLPEKNPIVRAIDLNQEKVVQEWLKQGHSAFAKVDNKLKERLIDRAATKGADQVFAVLLKAMESNPMPTNYSWRDSRGTPMLLSLASLAVPSQLHEHRYEQMIELFLKTHASQINDQDRAYVGDGRTALHQVASNGNTQVLQLLLKYGADVNARNTTGETPLHFAARFGQISALRFLIANKAKLNEKSKHTHATPLLAAAEMGHENIIRTLLEAGAKKTERDIFGKTAPERYEEYVAHFYEKSISVKK